MTTKYAELTVTDCQSCEGDGKARAPDANGKTPTNCHACKGTGKDYSQAVDAAVSALNTFVYEGFIDPEPVAQAGVRIADFAACRMIGDYADTIAADYAEQFGIVHDDDEGDSFIHESVDGSYIITYTHTVHLVAATATGDDEAEAEELGPAKDGSRATTLAYVRLRRAIREAINELESVEIDGKEVLPAGIKSVSFNGDGDGDGFYYVNTKNAELYADADDIQALREAGWEGEVESI